MDSMIMYLLAMIGGLTIIASIMVLFAYVLTVLEREVKRK